MINTQTRDIGIENYFSIPQLEIMARKTGFVQRRSPIDGFHFLLTFTTGMLNTTEGTLAQLAAFLASTCHIHISPQALDERFGPAAIEFMNACFQAALKLQRPARAHEFLGLLANFDHVYIVDSTGFTLHPSLAPLFKGAGGSGSKAAMRFQVAIDYITGQVYVKIGDIRMGDAPTLFQMISNDEIDLTGRCLVLSDLGYFKLDTLDRIQEKNLFTLSKLMPGVILHDANGEVIDLNAMLKKRPASFDMTVFIKKRAFRLVGCCLSEEDYNKKLRKANKTAADKGKSITDAYRLFLQYALFLTNLPHTFTMVALYAIYRVRWQIELVFKTWKSILKIHRIQSTKRDRIMCEIYGKLILATLASRLHAFTEAQSSSLPISFHRLAQALKSMAVTWACAIVEGKRSHQRFIDRFILFGLRICKKRSSKAKPTLETRLNQLKYVEWSDVTSSTSASYCKSMA